MSETGGSQIAYGDAMDAFPAWVSLTRVSGWDLRRGRTDELDRTPPGTASIHVTDLTGELGSGAEFPTHGRIMLRGSPRFRGHVESIDVEVSHMAEVTGVQRVTVNLVDGLDYLANVELIPGVHGFPPPAGKESYVFYEQAQVDDRIKLVLDDARWPLGLRSIFSGNVNVMDDVIEPGTKAIQLIDEACDAEMPTIANRWMRPDGSFAFRGRYSRLNPTAYPINDWNAGTGANVTTGVAQIRRLSYSSSVRMVTNVAMAYPYGIKESEIPAMVVTDETSIGKFGVRPWTAESLKTLRHNANGNTGADEAMLFSEFQVSNYNTPVPRITQVAFKSLQDSDPRAAATWALMQGVDIGDTIDITTDWISGTYFVEGITQSARELDGTIPYCETLLDLTPSSHWNTDPF